jgi:hypothetical protein
MDSFTTTSHVSNISAVFMPITRLITRLITIYYYIKKVELGWA